MSSSIRLPLTIPRPTKSWKRATSRFEKVIPRAREKTGIAEKSSRSWLLPGYPLRLAEELRGEWNSCVPPTAVSSREWYIPSWARVVPGRYFTEEFPPPMRVPPREPSPLFPLRKSLWHYRDSKGTWSTAISFLSSLPLSFSTHFVPAPFSYTCRCLSSLFAIRPYSPYSLASLFRVRSEYPAMRREMEKGIRQRSLRSRII